MGLLSGIGKALGGLGGAIIGGVSSLIGGKQQADAARDNTEASIAFQREQAESNNALQREFAQNGIRWKVEDAEAAGLHPLYALGGSSASFTPSAASVNFDDGGGHLGRALADAGQNVGRAVTAQQTPEQREAAQLQRQLLASQIGETDARRGLLEAQTRLATAPGTPSPTIQGAYGDGAGAIVGPAHGSSDNRGSPVSQHPLFKDAVKLEPDTLTSRDVTFDGQTAGRDHPGFRQFSFPGGFNMLLPAQSGGGMPEDIDASMIPFIVGANLERYGWRWMIDAIGYWSGRSPDERRGNTLESKFRYYFGGQRSVRGVIRQ